MDIRKSLEIEVKRELSRPMTRREFLARTGGIALSLVGVTAALKSLRGTHNGSYGSSSYGDR